MKKQASPIIEAPYGSWKSPWSLESVFDDGFEPAYPFVAGGQLYWLESLGRENGRVAVMTETRSGDRKCITPAEYDIRTRVHEYGGKCFCIHGDSVIFNNWRDGRLYRQRLNPDSSPRPLPAAVIPGCRGFADLTVSRDGNRVIGIIELEADEGDRENTSRIVAVSLSDTGADADQPGFAALVEGADFYASPVLSHDGEQIAWLEWSHPNMPWDRTRLVRASLEADANGIAVTAKRIVVDEPDRSVCQPGFTCDGLLLFVSDDETTDRWNFYSHDGSRIRRLTHSQSEFGEPHWVFGQSRWRQSGHNLIYAVGSNHSGDRIFGIHPESGRLNPVGGEFAACRQLFSDDSGSIWFVGCFSDRQPQICRLETRSNRIEPCLSGSTDPDRDSLSIPQPVSFPDGNRNPVYGYFYPPCNRLHVAPAGTLPPLLVVTHGGPTGRTTPEYSSIRQYFCSIGFALLDINHRGSSGYGRAYRQQLLGQWGVFDVDDIVSGIDFAAGQGWIDPGRVFIRGSSAGGFVVLSSLTRYPERFAGGSCYYGIGNLITLSEITHKFESKYTDNLLGEKFDPVSARRPDSRYVSRSPLFHLDSLNCPLILFQGEDDKIVPPEVAREVADSLRENGLEYEYAEYPGEGHGFRSKRNRLDALGREIDFFVRIINS